jgi:DNA invertase Pin-like site-specific DNA recombinase
MKKIETAERKEGKMKKEKRAIGYVCDIPIEGTDLVITKQDQLARMVKYCEKEGVDLVCVFEDDKYTEDFMNRPGVQKLLDCKENCDTVLVERVWCLSRKMKELKPFLAELERKNMTLVASSYLWDCVSQQVRQRYMGALAEKQRAAAREKAGAKQGQAAA